MVPRLRKYRFLSMLPKYRFVKAVHGRETLNHEKRNNRIIHTLTHYRAHHSILSLSSFFLLKHSPDPPSHSPAVPPSTPHPRAPPFETSPAQLHTQSIHSNRHDLPHIHFPIRQYRFVDMDPTTRPTTTSTLPMGGVKGRLSFV
jgi:hypothetical protein